MVVVYCVRRRDEYGNRHDELAVDLHMLSSVAEIVERGETDEYRDIIVFGDGVANIISIVRAGAETYCHEHSNVSVDEACEIIRKYIGRRDVDVLIDQSVSEICRLYSK